MTKPARLRDIRARLIAGGALAALMGLTACDVRQPDPIQASAFGNASLPPLPEALPMTAETQPLEYAPAAARLPAARQLSYADPGDDGYAWIDRADTVFDVIGDAPPDYGFDYDDVEPWGWEAAGGYVTYAEPIDDDYYRYYYYEPGADYPYLVRDPWNSYGYSGDRIVAVYDAGGALLPWAMASQRVDYGSRYYARAADLRRAAARERRGVAAPVWAERRPAIVQAQRQWAAARETQPAWREWRQRDGAQVARAQVREERQARRAAAQRFASWQQEGLRGSAPDLYGRAQRQADRAQRQAARVAQRQTEREQPVFERARADVSASQQRRREMMQVRDVPQGGAERVQIREQRQAEREARRGPPQAREQQQQQAVRQAQRAEMQAQRQQRMAERQQLQGEVRQQAERQQRGAQREAMQAARRQQGEQRQARAGAEQRAQMQAAREQQRAARQQQQAARQQQAAERQQAAGRQQQMAAAREQQRAERQQQQAARQQQAAERQQQMAARQQQQQQMNAAREQQRAAREQQAAARQQQMAQRQAEAASRQQQAAAQQQARQAEMAARQQQRAERQAQGGGGGGGERRGKRD
ncbi:hypothetical protein M9978_00245 [Sphingomonas sp. MG17]|uniref:Uncharacterized protein n=1 Tax=Sphingomonas tagetis TaxID=2949092 RepID=A0A9X2KJR3_9SPHN|nr:hypothetical protein [Sphingomonas tagetis]MCP3728847.1 hypothetical protein [Sphingomonas tagetis]